MSDGTSETLLPSELLNQPTKPSPAVSVHLTDTSSPGFGRKDGIERVTSASTKVKKDTLHIINSFTEFEVPDKIPSHPTEGHWKFLGEGESYKAKSLEAKYDAKLEFPWAGGGGGGGWGVQRTFRGGII